MTRQDIADVIRVLGISLIEASRSLETGPSRIDSQPEPEPAKTAPEASQTAIAVQARKRGRPKKDSQTHPNKQPIPEPSGDELVKCDLCGREIPADALSIHHINCAAAQAGYWDQK